MRPTRFISLTALYTALLICVQFIFSGVAGVELVTVFFLCFCFTVGIKAGITVAVCFCFIRCFIFGFYPSVIILYLVYYTGFAVFFGFWGKKFNRSFSVYSLLFAVLSSTVFAGMFTLIDDVITPLFYGFNTESAIAYFYSSLPFMLTQCICVAVSVFLLFFPLCKALDFAIVRNNK